MDSIFRQMPKDYDLDSMMSEHQDLYALSENLDLIETKIIKYSKKRIQKRRIKALKQLFKEIRPDKNKTYIRSTGTTIKWKVKPKLKFKKILEKDLYGGLISDMDIYFKIEQKMDGDTVLFATFDGKPFKLNDDGTFGDFKVKAGGTLKF